jgi:hypothetical protein
MPKKNFVAPVSTSAFVSFCLIASVASIAQQPGAVTPTGSRVHVSRALVGAKGEVRNGMFVMTEQRSTFYASEDREVIVYWGHPSDEGADQFQFESG